MLKKRVRENPAKSLNIHLNKAAAYWADQAELIRGLSVYLPPGRSHDDGHAVAAAADDPRNPTKHWSGQCQTAWEEMRDGDDDDEEEEE